MIKVKLLLAVLAFGIVMTVCMPRTSRAAIGDSVPGGIVTNVTKISGVGTYYTIYNPATGMSSIIGPI